MAKVAVIGGSGHVGTYLVPRLVRLGHRVVNVSRGQRRPYRPDGAWTEVETLTLDRAAAEADGSFASRIAALEADIVVDMICFTLASAEAIVAALKGRVQHFLHCGTIWVYGHNPAVPATEADPTDNAFGEYGTRKAAIERYLLGEARRSGFPATVFRPGHIVGPGWAPLNPAANFNLGVFETIARGDELSLPNFGLETVHHVHADDVAQMVVKAINSRVNAVGETFNTVSPAALNLKGYAEAMYGHFGRAPKLSFAPYEQWRAGWSEDDARATLDHISRSPAHSIDKARRLLGYSPRYTSLEAVEEAVGWLVANGKIQQ
jgi:nucleoside-diphosphate-sugar epimerase